MREKIRTLALLGLCALLGASLAWGQAFTASILGTVKDNSGSVVPQAIVTITNIATGNTTSAVSDSNGDFTVSLLPPGDYRVTVEAPGFKRSVQEPVTLLVDQRQHLDFSLELGQVSENVTVTAETSQVQADTATVGTAVTQAQTSELPLNGRNFLQLDLLIPGAQPTVKGSNLSGEGGSIEVHGLRENSNSFWIDGMDNETEAIGELVVNPPQYSIEEFRVMSPTYDAEFGRTAGAQINVILRSGGNAYHGDIYLLLRNSFFDAKNFFDPPGRIPAYRRGQYGADVGGRIKRDRTFFYAAFDGLTYAQGESASAIVPTEQEVHGNFSALSTPIKDPTTGLQFPGNIIPASRINQIGANIASYFPAPNTGTNTLLVSPTGTDSDNVVILKIDQILSSANHLTGRIAYEDINYNQPISQYSTYTNIPGFGLIENANHNYTTGINDTHTFSPNLLGEFRVGWNRFEFHYLQYLSQTNTEAALGITGVPSYALPRDWGFPQINMSGTYSNLGSSYPQYGPFDTTFVAPTLTWVKGKHTLKFGVDYHHFFSNYIQDGNIRGTFTFNGTYTGNSLGDLLLGLPNQATIVDFRNLDSEYAYTLNEAAGFVQDSWQMSSGLTVTLGLRYEYMFPATEERNRFSSFDPSLGQLVQAGSDLAGCPPGLCIAGGRTLFNADPHEFGPRAGFTWSPTKSSRWAIRGGYGIFYELMLFTNLTALRSNLPDATTNTILGNGSTITLNNVFSNLAGTTYPTVAGVPQNWKAGRVQQFSFGVQRELLRDLILDVGYVGTRGDHLYGTLNINQPPPGPGTVQSRRPYPDYASINMTENEFSSHYDGLEVRLEKRFSNGIHLLAAYTHAKSYDNSSASGGTNTPQYAFNLADNWGLSSFDIRNRFVFSYLYDLPWGRGRKYLSKLPAWEDAFIGGWKLNGIYTGQSGQPFTPVLPTDNSNTGQLADWPNVVGNPMVSTPTCQVHTPSCWVNPAAFAAAPKYSFGDVQRDALEGPGLQDWDFAMLKDFVFAETRRLEFRAEAFNVLNKVNFDNPTNTLGSSFGRILTAEPARQIQLGLRFVY
jgi:hypothetical protein